MKKYTSNKKRNHSNLLTFAKFIALVFPLALYILIITCIFPAPNSGFIALGIAGSFLVGLSFVNLTGLLDDMYMGHLVTILLAVIGSFFIATSSLIMYVPSIYSQLNEQHSSFYFLAWGILIVLALYYSFFRHAVVLFLRKSGMSKTKIKESLEGRRNFWWYESHKNEKNFAWIYKVNKIFTILFPFVGVIHALFGWIKSVFPLVTAAICILALLNLRMYSLVVNTWDSVKSEPRKASKLKISIGFLFPVMAICGIILYLMRIW